LAALRGTDIQPSLAEIGNLEHLARFDAISEQGGEPWARLDLADTLLLTGRVAEGLTELTAAASAIPLENRADTLGAVAAVHRDFLTVAAALPPQTVTGIRSALDVCTELSKPEPAG